MTNAHRLQLFALVMLSASTDVANAQACLGQPQRSSIAYERAKRTVGTSNGASGTLARGPIALTLAGRMRDIAPTLSGWEANIGFIGVLSASKVKICPGVGFLFQRDSWDVDATTSVNSQALDLGAGVGIGVEQELYKGFSIIPFLAAKYRFNAIAFDLKTAEGENTVTGDTLSGVHLDYGVSGHYRFLYGGIALSRRAEAKGIRPQVATYIIGVTLSGKKD